MAGYVVKRLLLMVPALWGVTVVVFLISRMAPGSPITSPSDPSGQLAGESPESVLETRAALYGLDRPIYVQYAQWLGNVSRLDFGRSIKHHRPVISLIRERLPITIGLNLAAFVIIYAVAIPVGIVSAVRQGRAFDRVSSVLLLVLWSLPVMWAGQLLIGTLTGPDHLNWFPPSGLSSVGAQNLGLVARFTDRLWHLVLPVLCLSYTGLAYLAKQVRSAVLENLSAGYVTAARAKGLPEHVVVLRHVFRNSLLPLITITANVLPAMFAGSVIVERIFAIPGMGRLTFDAVAARDYNVIMAVTTIAGVLNCLAMLTADVAYAMVDPRVTFEAADR